MFYSLHTLIYVSTGDRMWLHYLVYIVNGKRPKCERSDYITDF